ncbi:MAG: hypothetical protein ABI927_00665 [Gaiellaceae bacterium]
MRSGGVVVRRRGVAGALVATLVAVSVTTAATAGAPSGSPALDRMALAVGDLAAGGSIRRQGYVKDRAFVAYYVREFKPGASIGTSVLSGLESDIGVTTSRAEAVRLVGRIATTLRSKSARRALMRGALQDAGWGQASLKIAFGGIRGIAGGDAAFMAPLTLSLPGRLRLAMVFEVVRVDRAVQVLYLLSAPNTAILPAEASGLISTVAARMHAGLIPAGVAPPTVSGTAQEGQTLSVAVGSWTNSPTAYALRWLRCTTSGAGCVPIDGAVATDYVLATADVGFTIEVTVVATNAVGSSEPATSAPSAIILGTPSG